MTETGVKVKRCLSLTLEQSDALFFPGVGSKVSKARKFCAGCPLQNSCLLEAITNDLQGFYAGTTWDERKDMREFIADLEVKPIDIDEFLPKLVVEAPKGRRVVRRKYESSPDPYHYLDELEPLLEELV